MQQHVYAIVQAAEQQGVKHAVISPGSRSAPLVLAFTQSKAIRCYSVVDERSAAFMALGMAQQLQQPVVLICTSGTAALNFYPAVAEAFYQKVPLLILTADRPPELLNQQDGQMIMQKGVYGTHVLESIELPCYPHGKENLKETRDVVSAAVQKQQGAVKGPVHINVPLSEPLYPQQKQATAVKEFEFKETLPLMKALSAADMKYLQNAWQQSKRKLILLGQMPVNNSLFKALLPFAQSNDVVILADVLSNKQSICTAPHFDFIISQSNTKQLQPLEPDLVISLGGPVLSKALKGWLKAQKPAHHIRIQQEEEPVDTYRNVTRFIKADAAIAFQSLTTEKTNSSYRQQWTAKDEQAATQTGHFITTSAFSELHATGVILDRLPDACNLHIANSSVIRYISYLGRLNPSWIMSGNRGTSGIDGCTSTAVGAALVNNRPTVLVTGDLGFLYDRNALWNAHVPHNLRIIVFNNFGGGIFRLIDGPAAQKQQLDYFTTPHKQSIKNTVLDNGLDHYFCDSPAQLPALLNKFLNPMGKAAVMEITFNMEHNATVFKAFKKITF